MSNRIVGFLLLPKNSSPHARGAIKERPAADHGATPGGRPRRNAAVKVHNRGSNNSLIYDTLTNVCIVFYVLYIIFLLTLLGYSDEEYETDPETKVRGPKVARDESADSDVSLLCADFITCILAGLGLINFQYV